MNNYKEIHEFISRVSIKYNVPKDKIKSCASLPLKRKLLFSSVNKETIVLSDKYKLVNGTVISKLDGNPLDKTDVIFLEEHRVKYILPLSMDTQVYETKINPITDFDNLSDDEDQD